MRKMIFFGIVIFLSIVITLSVAISATDKKKAELYKQAQLFSDTLAIIQSDYVEEPKSKDLIYGALKGMLSSLDPHSQFMAPETYNELKVNTEGKFGGIGIEITIKDGLLTVVTPIEDTPAWKAGIKANDRIVKINNELTRDISITEAVKKMRGNSGDPVNITILRESEKKILDLKIIRDIIRIKDIKEATILDNQIAYIRLIEFSENTANDLDKALNALNKTQMKGIILDLRNNPGGLLESAVKVVERFIEKNKLVVYTKARKQSQNLELISRYGHPILDLPIIVLINEGSASGSEIVAGALQDYGRALVVGVKSFGKGSVQTVIPLGDGSALRLTTSKYFTPNGKEIHGKGIIPDIVVQEAKIMPETGEEAAVEDKSSEVFDQVEKRDNKPENKIMDKYKNDVQLMRSMDILKGIIVYRNIGKK
ncbi:MAG: S41 family peptidase [Candidatus Omnitrophota bacterium]